MDENQLAAVHVIVRGYVQGVFFRAATEAEANTLGLTGYVSNQPDGCSVEVLAEGKRKSLKALLAYLKIGPPRAWVEKVTVEWSAYSGRYSSFNIK